MINAKVPFLLLAVLLGTISACDEEKRQQLASASDEERQEACDALRSASSTAKLVQAGATIDDPSAIDATGAPRLVMLKGEAENRTGYLEVNVDDASFLLLVGASVPVTVMDASGVNLPLTDEQSAPSWCDAAGQVRLWRAPDGQRSILFLGPTAETEVPLVLMRTAETD